MNIVIGGAWPYANGSLHIGHIAALLPGDILARYHRLAGDDVCYVSGSDCHGTPIVLRARQEGLSPAEVADRYHEEFKSCFDRLGFSYDEYGKTSSAEHTAFVSDFHKKLYQSDCILEKIVEQAYCPACRQFLPDRFVVGICPRCGKQARGDQCDACGAVLEPENLLSPACSLCQSQPEFKLSTHLFLALPRLQEFLSEYASQAWGWRKNAVGMTERYLAEGLRDRAITRDLDWGIDVPLAGYEGKKIYIWAENVLGYLSSCSIWAERQGRDWQTFWNEPGRHYYVHGKDNIPFHSIILPALLTVHGNLHLPDRIVSSEYLTLEGRKISTSQGWAIWVPDILERYHPDSIRYFLIANGPEKRDTDFSWREFVYSHNGELLGAFGNFVNRSLVFIQKSFCTTVPDGHYAPSSLRTELEDLYTIVGSQIEQTAFKDALEAIFALVRHGNKLFDEQQPWITLRENPEACRDTLYTCVQIIANLSNLLEPFLPFSCAKIRYMLKLGQPGWSYTEVPAGQHLETPEILFRRIDKGVIAGEVECLNQMNHG